LVNTNASKGSGEHITSDSGHGALVISKANEGARKRESEKIRYDDLITLL
jgi:hypothetical protein